MAKRDDLIFLLYPYVLALLHPLVVISRTILVAVEDNDLLYHLIPNNRNVIPTP